LTLAEVGRFYVSRQLAILGCSPDLADEKLAAVAA
jgi:hypothetical protein